MILGALRFGADEARALLNDVDGLVLSGGDVAALTDSKDGCAGCGGRLVHTGQVEPVQA